MHPLAKDLLITLGRIGVRAGTAMVESALEDLGAMADEVSNRTKRARSRMRQQRVWPQPEEGEDDDA